MSVRSAIQSNKDIVSTEDRVSYEPRYHRRTTEPSTDSGTTQASRYTGGSGGLQRKQKTEKNSRQIGSVSRPSRLIRW